MIKFIIAILVLPVQFSFGQVNKTGQCSIEIYLLKKRLPNIDNESIYVGEFKLNKEDLEDSAFLTASDMNSYFIELGRDLFDDSSNVILGQKFNLTRSGINKIEKLIVPLSTGLQFALMVNKQIVYSGYFWSMISSTYCDWITAIYAKEESAIYISLSRNLKYRNVLSNNNSKINELPLFDCL